MVTEDEEQCKRRKCVDYACAMLAVDGQVMSDAAKADLELYVKGELMLEQAKADAINRHRRH